VQVLAVQVLVQVLAVQVLAVQVLDQVLVKTLVQAWAVQVQSSNRLCTYPSHRCLESCIRLLSQSMEANGLCCGDLHMCTQWLWTLALVDMDASVLVPALVVALGVALDAALVVESG
jgi:hypothetical protein